MGAPCVSFNVIISKLRKNLSEAAVRQSALFIVPSLATTLASMGLFYFLNKLASAELNALSVIVMTSVIISLIITGGIQFAVYNVAGETNRRDESTRIVTDIGSVLFWGILFSIFIASVVIAVFYPYFKYVLTYSMLQFTCFAILLYLFSIIWVFTSALWASGRHKYPAIAFVISYIIIITFSLLTYTINSVYVLYGYIIGAFVNVVLLGLSASSILGKNLMSRLGRGFVSIPKIIAKEYWGILFQTLSVIALFLDKILVWLWKGMQAGNGLQIIGSYTTGTFLGLIPTFSLFGLSHFAEKVRPLSKNMYSGTLDDIQKRVNELKQHYRRNLLITFLIWLAVFAIVVILSIFLIRDFTITRTVVLTGVAVLFLETILFNSIILPIFKKTYLSTFSMLAVCVCVGLSFLFGNSELNLSVGFVVGAFIGFLISHLATMKQLADFEYNAFRAFQHAD